MLKMTTTKDARTRFDPESGAVRSFFGAELIENESQKSGVGKTAADRFLEINKDQLKIGEVDLAYDGVRETDLFKTHRYHQVHNDIPVLHSHTQVTVRLRDARIVSNVNKLDYDLPRNLTPDSVTVTGPDAVNFVKGALAEKFGSLEIGEVKLFIYRHKERDQQVPYRVEAIREEMVSMGTAVDGQAYMCWRIELDTRQPKGYWEILVNAVHKELVVVSDRRLFVSLPAKVFNPDPITSTQDTSLSWGTPEATLNNECVDVSLENLDEALDGVFTLCGSWVKVVDRESPDFPTPETTTDFRYDAKDRAFLSVMAYYYLDRLINLLRSFGITAYDTASNDAIEVDAQGYAGQDNSHFVVPVGGTPFIAWGEGGVPDASDPGVICHEYGHALRYLLLGSGVPNSSYEEGFNDFLSCCFRDRYNTGQFDRANVFPWDNCPDASWSDYRRCDLEERFDDAGFDAYGFYKKGNVYATGLWDVYQNIGGNSGNPNVRRQAADEMLHMYLETYLLVGDNEPATDLIMGMIQVDEARTGGLYKKVIWDAFRRRGLWSDMTPEGNTDLCIRDSAGDTGEHASPSVHWHSPDIWVRNDPPDSAGENPDDGHQHPINDVPNYLYVNVHNRGSVTATADDFTVEAFHCDPATGMLWPDHFTSMGILGLTADVPSGAVMRVGPFIWTPHILDHECLVAVVHGVADPAIPATLSQTVDHWKIIRFDNNVGQRNVSPQLSVPGGKVKASFIIRGTLRQTINDLSIDARPLPVDTQIELRLPRSIVHAAAGLENLAVEKENSRYTTLKMTGGVDGVVRGFPMARGDASGVAMSIDFSYGAQDGRIYPIVATQVQENEVAGRLTIEIKAIKESEDYVYGNPRSMELHTIHCPFWNRISQHNKLPLESVKAGKAMGYDGCAYCLPHDHTR